MTTFATTRQLAARPEEVFAAMATPERLARWWGPAGFTNTVDVCEFRPGGTWRFTMHGPNGANFANESVFAEIDTNKRLVIDHISPPRYQLVIELSAVDDGTLISWTQTFEDARVAKTVAPIVVPANEQNLDRLTAEIGAA